MLREPWTPDRRRGDRRPVPFPLTAEVEGLEGPSHVRELGTGGMVVEAARPLPVGATVTCSIGSGNDTTGVMLGHVAHSRLLLAHRHDAGPVYLTGVAFVRVASDQHARIASWLTDIDQRGHGRPTRVP